MKEAMVMVSQEFVDRMRQIFERCINEEKDQNNEEKGDESENNEAMSKKRETSEKVDLNNFIGSIAEDEYFSECMNQVVRESLDGENESFEDLLNRILNDFRKPSISWL